MTSEAPVKVVDITSSTEKTQEPDGETTTVGDNGEESVDGPLMPEEAQEPVVDTGVEIEAEVVEYTTEDIPLTPAISEVSDVLKSSSNSGRVTPASQSDVASVSSSEKITPTRKRKSTDQAGRHMDFDNLSTSSGSIKLTKFPNRVGIHWKKGERLEAMDFLDKW